MYSLEWLVVSSLVTAIIAGLVCYWATHNSRSHKRTQQLEVEIANTKAAFDSYKNQVVEEFTETAEKFRNLNKSYVDLHHHLAKSADTLCGKSAAGILLEAPVKQRLETGPAAENTTPETSTETLIETSIQVNFENESRDEAMAEEENLQSGFEDTVPPANDPPSMPGPGVEADVEAEVVTDADDHSSQRAAS